MSTGKLGGMKYKEKMSWNQGEWESVCLCVCVCVCVWGGGSWRGVEEDNGELLSHSDKVKKKL